VRARERVPGREGREDKIEMGGCATKKGEGGGRRGGGWHGGKRTREEDIGREWCGQVGDRREERRSRT